MDETDKVGLWLVTTEGGNKFLLWSEPYKISEKKAIAKWRRLTKGRFDKKVDVTAQLVVCPVDGCWTFATELLVDGIDSMPGQGLYEVPRAWWFVGDVQQAPEQSFEVVTVCPMCEKHARRFRKTNSQRILRLEERLDDLERYQEES
jgi:hypothetical protein